MTRTDLHPATRTADAADRASPGPADAPRVDVRGLRCRYGDFEAVRGIYLQVRPGEVLALLGTNGAGKTTTLSALLGERAADGGELRVLGHDPQRDRRRIAPRLGVVFQDAGLPDSLTPRESVTLWRRLQGDAPAAIGDPDALLDRVGLVPRRDAPVGSLSGGERRRLELALALSGDPDLVILDEPTTGMDPSSRRTTWDLIRSVRDHGASVLLTTHYLEEAESLADRIDIMHHGQVARSGTLTDLVATHPATIGASVRQTSHARVVLDGAALQGDVRILPPTPDGRTRITVATAHLQADLHRLLTAADAARIALDDLRATPASLDAVFQTIADDTEDPR